MIWHTIKAKQNNLIRLKMEDYFYNIDQNRIRKTR